MNGLNIGLPEIAVLIVLAVIIFGPEKLPELARKAARVLKYVRNIANDARGQLTEQLGPEFSDLRPQALVQNLLGGETVDDVKAIATDVRTSMREVSGPLADAQRSLAKDGAELASAMAPVAAMASGTAVVARADAAVAQSEAAADAAAQPDAADAAQPELVGAHAGTSGNPTLMGSAVSAVGRGAPFDPEST